MPEADPPTERQVQAAQNQRLFKVLNENLRVLPAQNGGRFSDALVCECADMSCTDPIEIGSAEYTSLREHGLRFAVSPDHVFLDVERVISWHTGYWIVEKPAAAVAAADPDALPTQGFDVGS